MRKNIASAVLLALFLVLFGANARTDDWPTYMHDMHRSGVSSESLGAPLYLIWVHVPSQAPRPAWPEPAKQDFWNQVRELSPVVIYDRAYHVVSVGDAAYYGSSADDQVYCLDAATGALRWRYFTEGPVRLAPTVAEGRVYVGSDDGYVYCLDAATGALFWKYSPAEQDRRLPGNSRVISYAPARTGVVVDQGIAWFFAGLFPPDQVYRCALNAATGEVMHSIKTPGVSPQGYLLASSSRLFVPTGRTAPAMFDRGSLDNLGAVQGPGGAYALLVDDAVVSGPGVRDVNQLYYAPSASGEKLASFPGTRMLVKDGIAYLQSPTEASALHRQRYVDLSVEINRRTEAIKAIQSDIGKMGPEDAEAMGRLGEKMAVLLEEAGKLEIEREACYLWKKPAADPFSMILAGDMLFMGGQDRLYALRASDGEEVWQYPLEGRIYGLSAANGRLYASSNTGAIYCFSTTNSDEPAWVRMAEQAVAPTVDELSARAHTAAQQVLEDSGTTKGYCLLLGADACRMGKALVDKSDLNVICVETDVERAMAMRGQLADTGLYGKRMVVHHLADIEKLPYTTYMANLIVFSDEAGAAHSVPALPEIARLLRPYGGRAYLRGAVSVSAEALDGLEVEAHVAAPDWTVLTRGAAAGAGEWTQLYADAAHTAYSTDQLRGPVTVQWFGEPGPRDMLDRHHRPMSSLFKEGRLFITADNKIITVDGYNGIPLWELEAPDSRRVGSMKSSGHQLLAEDHLYIARADECWAVNTATGTCDHIIKAPVPDGESLDWGYLNQAENLLIGTLQPKTANIDKLSKATVNILEGDYRPVIISNAVFAADRITGEIKWKRSEGHILNAMMMINQGRLHLVESRNPALNENDSGRIKINEFLAQEVFLLAIDLQTGQVVWERPVQLAFEHIAYLNGRGNTLLATGSYNKDGKLYYDLCAFEADTGADKWKTTFRGLNIRGTEDSELEGSHGEQWQHPVISDTTIFARPYAFDLETGKQKDYIAYRGGHGCGGLTGSVNYLFGRGSVARMYPTDVTSTEGIPLTEVSRPGCFLNIIPAGGIIMIPESSSGCTCAYPLQTSIALAPRETAGGLERFSR